MSEVVLNLQVACNNISQLPSYNDFLRWLKGALLFFIDCVEVTIRLVDENESRNLNLNYRGKNKSTNVISFPFESPYEIQSPILGDLVICRQVVELEAEAQKKLLEAHWAHIVVHGTLHLLGYDHVLMKEIKEMEWLESKIMRKLGYLFSQTY